MLSLKQHTKKLEDIIKKAGKMEILELQEYLTMYHGKVLQGLEYPCDHCRKKILAWNYVATKSSDLMEQSGLIPSSYEWFERNNDVAHILGRVYGMGIYVNRVEFFKHPSFSIRYWISRPRIFIKQFPHFIKTLIRL